MLCGAASIAAYRFGNARQVNRANKLSQRSSMPFYRKCDA
jgi:hypothetical protein